jgi:two-component system sensor histidine kinase SenX3
MLEEAIHIIRELHTGELVTYDGQYYRVDSARSRETGGTGLGLAIVKHVAAGHGGEATVWSDEGTGSTFTLSIPAYDGGDTEDDHAREEETQ